MKRRSFIAALSALPCFSVASAKSSLTQSRNLSGLQAIAGLYPADREGIYRPRLDALRPLSERLEICRLVFERCSREGLPLPLSLRSPDLENLMYYPFEFSVAGCVNSASLSEAGR